MPTGLRVYGAVAWHSRARSLTIRWPNFQGMVSRLDASSVAMPNTHDAAGGVRVTHPRVIPPTLRYTAGIALIFATMIVNASGETLTFTPPRLTTVACACRIKAAR